MKSVLFFFLVYVLPKQAQEKCSLYKEMYLTLADKIEALTVFLFFQNVPLELNFM